MIHKTINKTIMIRTGSFVVYIGDVKKDELVERVGKILKKTDIKDKGEVCLVKLNYNGKKWIIPSSQLRVATKEEKKKDPKNKTYWTNEYTKSPILYFVDEPEII